MVEKSLTLTVEEVEALQKLIDAQNPKVCSTLYFIREKLVINSRWR